MIRQGRLIAVVVGTFLIGCAVLLIVIGCAATRSGSPKQQGHTEATREQTRSAKAASEEARCERTRTIKKWGEHFTTNDLPGCPKGGLLLGTDKPDKLAGQEGDDKIRALGGSDIYFEGGTGSDILHGGDGNDVLSDNELHENDGQRDKLYCGEGRDEYTAGKSDYVDSSCERKGILGGGA